MTSCRCPGVLGLNFFSAMVYVSIAQIKLLKTGRHVDGLAIFECDNRFFNITLPTANAAETLGLTLANQRVHCLHLDIEQFFNRLLDFRLGSSTGNIENHLICFTQQCRFLGNPMARG